MRVCVFVCNIIFAVFLVAGKRGVCEEGGGVMFTASNTTFHWAHKNKLY